MAINEDLQELESQVSNNKQANNGNVNEDSLIRAVLSARQIEKEAEEKETKQKADEIRAQKQQEEIEEIRSSMQEINTALNEAFKNDPDLLNTIEKYKEGIDGYGLVRNLGEVIDPEMAPATVSQLLNNDDYRMKLRKPGISNMQMKKLIKKAYKDVLTGGNNNKVPQMISKSVPGYNANEAITYTESDSVLDKWIR